MTWCIGEVVLGRNGKLARVVDPTHRLANGQVYDWSNNTALVPTLERKLHVKVRWDGGDEQLVPLSKFFGSARDDDEAQG